MHRDIKLENIMFKNKNSLEIVLLDFGLAQDTSNLNYLTKQCGSVGYIAPELLKNESYDEKVDIFSTGALLYALVHKYKITYDVNFINYEERIVDKICEM